MARHSEAESVQLVDVSSIPLHDEYHQYYALFRTRRKSMQKWFQSSPAGSSPGNRDVVIHFRCLTHRSRGVPEWYYVPPFQYFDHILQARNFSRVWLLTEPGMRQHPTVLRLRRKFGARLTDHTVEEDFVFLCHTKYIAVLTWGTFSWLGGFLSNAQEVHFPYLEGIVYSEWGRRQFCKEEHPGEFYWHGKLCWHWAATAMYFVDDDTRWLYHDFQEGRRFLTASDVFATPSPFTKEVLASSAIFFKGAPWNRNLSLLTALWCVNMSSCDAEWMANN
eukprot:gnl/MRDRNA2_/MRDRNA2_200437_c0_seq1.p1 gnl/MRDRNA2_/MRDRNA2_200437_c0~~gnl/MRDRNA2_/MRDRNA2_200437_c0_seq1.p1  ORF type:complete len:313 (+),score=31.65 gnl/MRDRNA2_/MRDRNA2_200437_c0_seq1:111-941(+)